VNAYRFLHRSGLRGLVRRVDRSEVAGTERIPGSGSAILVANHESIWDPFVLGVTTERAIHYLAKAGLFRWRPLAGVLRSLNAFPVERGSGDHGAIREAVRPPARRRAARSLPAGHLEVRAARAVTAA